MSTPLGAGDTGISSASETCARCGHMAPGVCPTCLASDRFLGGSIWFSRADGSMGVLRLCHLDNRAGPSCYTQETRDQSSKTGRWRSA